MLAILTDGGGGRDDWFNRSGAKDAQREIAANAEESFATILGAMRAHHASPHLAAMLNRDLADALCNTTAFSAACRRTALGAGAAATLLRQIELYSGVEGGGHASFFASLALSEFACCDDGRAALLAADAVPRCMRLLKRHLSDARFVKAWRTF